MPKTMQNKRPRTDTTPFSPKTNILSSGVVEYAEVIDIILNEEHPEYKGYRDIGKIFIRRSKQDYGKLANAAIVAYPLFPHQKYHPVRFEVVLIVKGPTPYAGEANNEFYYYISSFNAWNLVNHNAVPFIAGLHKQESSEDGSGRFGDFADKAKPDKLEFGDTFQENVGIPQLQPYEGDNILLGRWGNSLRFGSSTTEGKPTSPWSDGGTDGDPITIIRNTKPTTEKMGSIVTEDVNEDDSSIYLCSNQKLELETGSENYKAYKSEPEKPKDYQGNQVIITSDRLIFNTKKSDILLFSTKSIGLSATGTVNISADGEFIVDAKKHYIGAKAEEPIMFGKKTKAWLKELLNAIKAITVPTGTGPSGTPINMAQFDSLAAKIDQLLSQKSFVE